MYQRLAHGLRPHVQAAIPRCLYLLPVHERLLYRDGDWSALVGRAPSYRCGGEVGTAAVCACSAGVSGERVLVLCGHGRVRNLLGYGKGKQ